MNAEEIILKIYNKCNDAYKELKDYEKSFGYDASATKKQRAVWCELDDLYEEITGEEIDYTKYERE